MKDHLVLLENLIQTGVEQAAKAKKPVFCASNPPYQFFFINKHKQQDQQQAMDFSLLKKELALTLQVDGCVEGLQIVGDSDPFAEPAQALLFNEMNTHLQQHVGLVFYGFTSNRQGGANGVVNQCLQAAGGSELAKKTIANIIYGGEGTFKAIKQYRCSYGQEAKNFMVLFHSNQPEACQFGDDNYLSDQLAQTLFCLEGGVISFGQLINTFCLHVDPKLIVYTGLRSQEDKKLFSAAELFRQLTEVIVADSQSTNSLIVLLTEITHNYLSNHVFNRLPASLSASQSTKKIAQVNTAVTQLLSQISSLPLKEFQRKLNRVVFRQYNACHNTFSSEALLQTPETTLRR